jgi:hypothetical protein
LTTAPHSSSHDRIEVAADLAPARLPDALFIVGVVSMAVQSTQIGPLLPPHIWMFIALLYLASRAHDTVTTAETVTFLLFVSYATFITIFSDHERTKQYSQIVKFVIVYPGFFWLGRYYGSRYANGGLPLGHVYLFVLLAIEVLIQHIASAALFTPLDFADSALHGTFKERNWLADYFFLYSYILYETTRSTGAKRVLQFAIVNLAVMILSQSKTAMVACALAIAVRANAPFGIRFLAIAIGTGSYVFMFADQFSQEQIDVRIDEERGAAFTEAINLISANPLGYGFGFVESYFKNLPYVIRGLGEGTNSVFSVPLDLLIVAGPIGLVAWAVFFAGIGTGSVSVLVPAAALSLMNPLHQAESIYFFVGMLISINRGQFRGEWRRPPSLVRDSSKMLKE